MLNEFASKIQNARLADQGIIEIDQWTFSVCFNNQRNKHYINDIRARSTNCRNKDFEFDSPLENLLARICVHAYPSLLFSRAHKSFHTMEPRTLFTATPIGQQFFQLAMNDPDLQRFFRSNCRLAKSKEFFADALITKSFGLMRLRDQLSLEQLVSSSIEILDAIKKVMSGETVKIPKILVFKGACLGNDIKIPAFGGYIKPLHSGIADLLPQYYSQPKLDGEFSTSDSFIFETEIDYRLDFEQSSGKTPSISERYSWVADDFNKITQYVPLALYFSANNAGSVSLIFRHEIILDLIGYGFKFEGSTRKPKYAEPIIATEDRIKEISRWVKRLDKTENEKISLAMRRLLSAISHRTDQDDVFIDAIIGLENLFTPGRGNIKECIANCVSYLCEDRDNDRENIKPEIEEMYRTRSKIVHGKTVYFEKPVPEKAIKFLKKSIMNLHLKHPDILKLDTHQRSSELKQIYKF